jgi:CheY-like chemotaxis protein/anti-sigma regulatory factor (Ser/Thr protein kinase)
MASRILIVDDEESLLLMLRRGLEEKGFDVLTASNAETGFELLSTNPVDLTLLDVMMPQMDGLTMLSRLRAHDKEMPVIIMTGMATPEAVIGALRDQACDFLSKPFMIATLVTAIENALEYRPKNLQIEVLSARPEWIELRIPCDMAAIGPLERLMSQLKTDLPVETRDRVVYAFREMLRNAIEHGGKNDPNQFVEIGYLRTPRMILYRIKDPGAGFDMESLEHAAITNPKDDPIRHERVREEQGLRPGGFGILIARDMVDDMIYNEQRNEVALIKYLDAPAESSTTSDENLSDAPVEATTHNLI